MSTKNQGKCFKIYEAYLYGTVEEFVMFTLIYFNRSQHAFALQGTFKCFKEVKIDITDWIHQTHFPP